MKDERSRKDIARIKQEIGESWKSSTIVDRILIIFKAALASTPLAGCFSSLISDFIPSGRLHRVEQFVKQVAVELNEMKENVSIDYILTDEFAYIFEKAMRGAAENYQAEKLEAFRGILVNASVDFKASVEEKEFYINLVNNLTALHLRILRFLHEPENYLERAGIDLNSIQGGFSQFFPVAIPGIKIEVIRSAFDDLYRYGLINTDKSIFTTMTSGQGLPLLGQRLSPFGKSFIGFCISPKSDVQFEEE
jgi:hypothetical protein